MKKVSRTYFFEDKPLFGLDIGHDTLRVVQCELTSSKPRVLGYGSTVFDPAAIRGGVIVKPELIAESANTLFKKELTGDINTNRVAVSLPASRAITRAVRLPKLSPQEMTEAVQTELEQYIPGHIENMYLDFSLLREDTEGVEAFVVAMPKEIVDSYLQLTRMLGLEAVLLDTAIGASAKLFALDKLSGVPSVLIDFGTDSADITIFNHGLVVTGTVAFGGDAITERIAKKLHVTRREAIMLKSRFGLSMSGVQKQIVEIVSPFVELLVKEIHRTIRYYEQRYADEPSIGQIVTMGGGANMPGIAEHLTDRLRLPVRSFDPTAHISFGNLRPFYMADKMSYVTAAGLAIINPTEVFA